MSFGDVVSTRQSRLGAGCTRNSRFEHCHPYWRLSGLDQPAENTVGGPEETGNLETWRNG